MATDRRPPWEKPTPSRRDTARARLTAAQKAAARQRAEENGRRYPNLVDTLWALKLPHGDDAPQA